MSIVGIVGGVKSNRNVSRPSNNRQPIATKPSGLRRILNKMRRSNSGHSLGDNLVENSGHNGNNNNSSLAEEVKESNNGWDGGRASITFSPHRFSIALNCFQSLPIILCSRLEEWDAETVCRWFDSLGLYMYTNEVG